MGEWRYNPTILDLGLGEVRTGIFTPGSLLPPHVALLAIHSPQERGDAIQGPLAGGAGCFRKRAVSTNAAPRRILN
jgi:hypothetical protein